jgi:CHAT domain-containing protein
MKLSGLYSSSFKGLPLHEYRLMHLAVHGVASPQFPERASLVLGRPKLFDEDGLHARETGRPASTATSICVTACKL